MILYRPVGLQELELIYDSGMKAFPARLPQQPIFYPVLDLAYARQIASDWNAKSGQFAGYITQFKVEDEYINRFEMHAVGGSQHQEFWIPAEELEEFNRHILGHIKVVEAYFSDAFQGFIPEKFGLEGKDAVAQFTLLTNTFIYKRMEFLLEIKRNHKAIYLNYPFWQKSDFKNPALKEKVLQGIRETWLTSFPQTPLVDPLPKDSAPAKQNDVQAPVDPDDEDPPLVRQIEAPKRTPPEQKTASRPLGKPAREDPPSVKPAAPPSSVKPVPNDPPPSRKKEIRSFVIPPPEDGSLIKGGGPPSFEKPAHQGAPQVNKPAPQSFPNHVPEEATPLRRATSFFTRGLELGLDGKYQEAVDELTRAVDAEPGHLAARTSLGVALHRLGEDDRALSCYEAVLKIDPKDAEAHFFRANILHGRGNVREAISEYTTAIGLKPELIRAHEEPVPRDRLTDYSDVPAGMYQIARHAFRILELDQSLASNPRQSNLFKERASAYSRLGNDEQAIADYDSCLAIQPDDAGALHARGLAYERMGQSDRALRDYQQATSTNPQLADVYINRGVALGKAGQYRQSIESLTEGIRLAPTNPNSYFNRAATYLQLGDFENAITDFSRVIQLSSNDEDAYYWRGISHEEAGHRNEAIADYKQFLTLSQNPDARDEIEQKLDQWNAGNEGSAKEQGVVSEDRKKVKQAQAVKAAQESDLYELLAALGDRALDSIWLGSEVDCQGEKADELQSLSDEDQGIDGRALLNIASGIHQTVKGDFQAFDPGANSPWIFIRAWKGSGFYVETNDPRIKKRLKSHFPSVEDVEDVPSPYEGLFIRIGG
jgi:tetratricopeptide (TPR) repeat protein